MTKLYALGASENYDKGCHQYSSAKHSGGLMPINGMAFPRNPLVIAAVASCDLFDCFRKSTRKRVIVNKNVFTATRDWLFHIIPCFSEPGLRNLILQSYPPVNIKDRHNGQRAISYEYHAFLNRDWETWSCQATLLLRSRIAIMAYELLCQYSNIDEV